MTPPPHLPEDSPPPPPDGGNTPNSAEGPVPVGPAPTPGSPLDDPLFADFVDSRPRPDITLTTAEAASKPDFVLEAAPIPEPPSTPSEALTAAAVPTPGVSPAPPTTPPDLVDAEIVDALPVARVARPPVAAVPTRQPSAAPERPRGKVVAPPPDRATTRPVRGPRPFPPIPSNDSSIDEVAQAPARPRVFAACAVMGCLGVALLVALGVLAICAIQILDHLGNRITDQPNTSAQFGPGPGPITPTRLVGTQKRIPLGGEFDAVGRGANGRYLLLRIPQQKSLVIFDPVAAEVTHRFDLGDPKALFAAGASKLFVYKPSSATLERWDLETKQAEQTATLSPQPRKVDAIAMGAGPESPLYVISIPDIRVFDPVTLTQTASYPIPNWQSGAWTHVRASDDGTVLGVTGREGALMLRYHAQAQQLRPTPLRVGDNRPRPEFATPAPDGTVIYTPRGVFSPTGEPFGGLDDDFVYFPADHGGLFLSREIIRGKVGGPIRLHTGDSVRNLGELGGHQNPQLTLPGPLERGGDHDVTADQRTHLWPAAGLLVALPVSNNEIEMSKVDLEGALKAVHKATRQGYAVIWTDPPRTVVRGTEWRYHPQAWVSEDKGDRENKKPSLFRWVLKSPPEGMKVVENKDIVWTPDSTSSALVQLLLLDSNGGTLTSQTFRLNVVGPAP